MERQQNSPTEVGLITDALRALTGEAEGAQVVLVENGPDKEEAIKNFMAQNQLKVTVVRDSSEIGTPFRYVITLERSS